MALRYILHCKILPQILARSLVGGRINPAHNARTATKGNRRDIVLSTPVQERADGRLVARIGDRIRGIGKVAPENHPREIVNRAAVRMEEALILLVGAEGAQTCRERDPRRAQCDLRFARQRHRLETLDVEQLRPGALELTQLLRRHELVLVSPTKELAPPYTHGASQIW